MAANVRSFLLLLFVTSISLSSAYGNAMPLFAPSSPAFINISEVKEEIQTLVDDITNRLRCVEHGLQRPVCEKCLTTDHTLQLLNLDPSSKSLRREDAEDLAILLVHHVLFFESLCTSNPPGCRDFEQCQNEVLETMGTYSTFAEPLEKILRIFKMVLNAGEKKECFSAYSLLEDYPPTVQFKNSKDEVRFALRVLMGRIFEGYCIDAKESTTDFLDDIFHHYGDSCSPYMTLNGLKRMINDLQNARESHDHGHNHHHHHNEDNHDHDHGCAHSHELFSLYHSHDHAPARFSRNDIEGDEHSHDDHYHSHDHPNHDHDHSDHDHDHSIKYDRLQHNHGHDDLHVNNHILASSHENSSNSASVLQNGTSSEEDISGEPSPASSDTKIDETSIHIIESTTISNDNNSTEIRTQFPNEQNMSHDNFHPSQHENFQTFEEFLSKLNFPPENMENTEQQSVKHHRATRSSYEHISAGASSEENSKDFSGPSSSLRSDISHQEKHGIHGHEDYHHHTPSDDVKKVYLLQNEDAAQDALNSDSHKFASLAGKCLSAEDLMQKFGHQENSSLTKNDFLELCPALIQQIVSGVCTEPSPPLLPKPSRVEVYGYSSLAVFLITLTSLAGVLLLPVMTKRAYHYIISGFYGLAFSTLAGDALLHLMPQFLGLHSHGPSEDHGHSHDEVILEPYVQLQLGVICTIYVLYLFEAILCAFSKSNQHSHKDNKGHGHSHVHLPDELPTLMSVKTKSETTLPVSRDQSNSSLDTEIVDTELVKKPPNLMVSEPICFGLTTMALVVTLGDSFHNFGDGLAIGAAFSTGIRGGLSTAIAVFCHELPHEFGDFVVLLSTGLSFSKALLLNFLSGLTCFAGLYIGIYIGDNDIARKWIMAVTAGIFLYVALGEMLPELREHSYGSPVKMLFVKNLGILAGVAIMLVISIYEHDIV